MDNIITELNIFLSDLNVFYRKLQNYHWNIIGPHFFVLHVKLEEYYDEISIQIDEIAEHILMLGKQPLGTMNDYLKNTCIIEAKNEKVKDNIVLDNVIMDYETLLKKVNNLKRMSDEQSLYVTSSLMDNFITSYTKHLWMLKQTKETNN